jgi:hypothetical protein
VHRFRHIGGIRTKPACDFRNHLQRWDCGLDLPEAIELSQLRQSGFPLFRSGQAYPERCGNRIRPAAALHPPLEKVEWSINQADAALCALFRMDLAPIAVGDVDTVAKLDAGFLSLLPRLGIIERVMDALNLTPDRDLFPLLACLAPIGIHDGVAWVPDDEGGLQQRTVPSLYRQMFLNPTLLKRDPVFNDNGYGEFLSDSTKKLADRADTLRLTFNLSGEESDADPDTFQFPSVHE